MGGGRAAGRDNDDRDSRPASADGVSGRYRAAALAAGFATATGKRALIAHPVLAVPAWNVEIGGFVEAREERERSDRIVVRVERISGPRLNEQLERVRVSVRKGTAPAVGSFVEFAARLSPPLEPLRPGGYDFARDMYNLTRFS